MKLFTQIQAARLVAQRRPDKEIYESLDICHRTFYSWKADDSFKECVKMFAQISFERESLIAEMSTDLDASQSREDEIWMREQLRPILESLASLTQKLIDEANSNDEVTLNPRSIPRFINALTGAFQAYRISNDRITGLESIIDDLGALEEAFNKEKSRLTSSSSNQEV